MKKITSRGRLRTAKKGGEKAGEDSRRRMNLAIEEGLEARALSCTRRAGFLHRGLRV